MPTDQRIDDREPWRRLPQNLDRGIPRIRPRRDVDDVEQRGEAECVARAASVVFFAMTMGNPAVVQADATAPASTTLPGGKGTGRPCPSSTTSYGVPLAVVPRQPGTAGQDSGRRVTAPVDEVDEGLHKSGVPRRRVTSTGCEPPQQGCTPVGAVLRIPNMVESVGRGARPSERPLGEQPLPQAAQLGKLRLRRL